MGEPDFVSMLVYALAGPAGMGLIFAVVVVWDRLRAPHRDIRRPVAIGGYRDYRDACRQVDKLVAAGDWARAYVGTVAIRTWLRSERHYGGRRRRARLAAELERWTARQSEYGPSAVAPLDEQGSR
ncbi:hypothetical protein K1T35_47680 (plasmid) [Pseudonocardia sp. DSM 110487]|uniref:hypothetical protein n=1 Tax=Pseudonocardia sp. DSM 110487 TaxID=2865833 RepID=UPI001C69A1ED|nr:hypothetical protein [Pseudonocardia sp. DSM 110487]QYN41032.1 hypothetical protein K1T35_47680 [Pseudonocardia sp. DSM 110487]